MHYKEISIWKAYLKAVKLKITTAAFLLDRANNDAPRMSCRGLVASISHNKTLTRDRYKPWELHLMLKIQQVLASHTVYLHSAGATQGFPPSKILF